MAMKTDGLDHQSLPKLIRDKERTSLKKKNVNKGVSSNIYNYAQIFEHSHSNTKKGSSRVQTSFSFHV